MEVELKFHAPDGFEEKLVSLGAKKVSEQDEKDVHYDRNGELLKQGKMLRVRTTASQKILTYKGPHTRDDIKAKEEIETPVEGNIDEILSRLNFQEDKIVSKEKHRITYELDGVTVNIDDVRRLGRFVEFELLTDDVDGAKERFSALADKLGLKGPIVKSYNKMLRELNTSEG